MKPTTKKQAIALLMSKRWVSTLLCLQLCNTYRLSARVSEIQKHVTVERRTKKFKSKFGFTETITEYKIVRDEWYEEGMKQLFKSK